MKNATRQIGIIGMMIVLFLGACRTELSPFQPIDDLAVTSSAEDAGDLATLAARDGAYELLSRAARSSEELQQLLRGQQVSPKQALRLSLAPATSDISYLCLTFLMEIVDGSTGQLLKENDPAAVDDKGAITYRCYYSEGGLHPIKVEGAVRDSFVFNGEEFVFIDSEYKFVGVTATFAGRVVNQVREFADADDPYLGVAGATISLKAFDAILGPMLVVAKTDEEGYFSIETLEGQDYRISILADGFSSFITSLHLTADDILGYHVSLVPREDGDVPVGLIPLTGQVVDLRGNPVRGALISAVDSASGQPLLSDSCDLSDENGNWRINLPPGTGEIEVFANYSSSSTSVVIGDFPATNRVSLVLPMAPLICRGIDLPGSVSAGEEVYVELLVDQPRPDNLYVSFWTDEENGGVFPIGNRAFHPWTIWLAPPTPGDYQVYAYATSGGGNNCYVSATIQVE